MPTVQQLAVHPPLTSLRSFAPPYASEGGVHPPSHSHPVIPSRLLSFRAERGIPPLRET